MTSVFAYARVSKPIAWINYSYLKSVFITSTDYGAFFWEPEMIVKNDMVWFKLEAMPGTVRVG